MLPNGDPVPNAGGKNVRDAALDNISATEWRPLPAEGDGTVSLLHSIISVLPNGDMRSGASLLGGAELHSIISVLPNGDLFISSTRTPASSCTR